MFGIGKSGIGERCGAVECEIEVLYDILAWGVLEKMKTHPLSSNARKSTKSGVAHFRPFCQVLPGAAVHVARPHFTIHCVLLYSLVLYIAL